LNAPYKIDSMVWMRLGYISFSKVFSVVFCYLLDYINQGLFLKKGPQRCVIKVLEHLWDIVGLLLIPPDRIDSMMEMRLI
jgi:hypothetical protein